MTQSPVYSINYDTIQYLYSIIVQVFYTICYKFVIYIWHKFDSDIGTLQTTVYLILYIIIFSNFVGWMTLPSIEDGGKLYISWYKYYYYDDGLQINIQTEFLCGNL